MIMRRLRIASWIAKGTDTLKIFNTYWFSMTPMVRQARFNVTSMRILLALSGRFLPSGMWRRVSTLSHHSGRNVASRTSTLFRSREAGAATRLSNGDR